MRKQSKTAFALLLVIIIVSVTSLRFYSWISKRLRV